MDTLAVAKENGQKNEVQEAAKAYASSKFEWFTVEWDIARIAFEAGAKFQNESSQIKK